MSERDVKPQAVSETCVYSVDPKDLKVLCGKPTESEHGQNGLCGLHAKTHPHYAKMVEVGKIVPYVKPAEVTP